MIGELRQVVTSLHLCGLALELAVASLRQTMPTPLGSRPSSSHTVGAWTVRPFG